MTFTERLVAALLSAVDYYEANMDDSDHAQHFIKPRLEEAKAVLAEAERKLS
jgi:hypothetical protein